MRQSTLTGLIEDGLLDAELAALLWKLVAAGTAVQVIGATPAEPERLRSALDALAAAPGTVTAGRGDAIEAVLALPVPFRPAQGAVIVVRDGRVAAAHLIRPPLRDAGGHVRPQGPAVLATWSGGDGVWEHFAWGITPELAALAGEPAGDFEIDQGRRRAFLEMLVAAGVIEADAVGVALRGYGVAPTVGQ